MNIPKKRTWDFPRNAEANFGGEKVCKRSAYKLAYFLLTFAYLSAYSPAYLHATGKAGNFANALERLVLWVEKIICYEPSCSFSQN